MEIGIYFATNRKHQGKDRFNPSRYGSSFSSDGIENLRFGRVSLIAEDSKVDKHLNSKMRDLGVGNGEDLAEYLANCARSANIKAYPEKISADIHEDSQESPVLGSQALFNDIQDEMRNASDVLVYIHGFNVKWEEAVGSAMALQLMLRNAKTADPTQKVLVVLFSWPSDGMALPWVSYKSDRSEAAASGAAVGRAFLKLRDFLAFIRDRAKTGGRKVCGQDIHLLCHSMGNYLLQHALTRTSDYTPGTTLPRMFEHVFLCAPDVDDDALEPGKPLASVTDIARFVTVYHNKEDSAMSISDYTKGNPDRLGGGGAARVNHLHGKISQVDCTPVVHGLVEHSYYQCGNINADIRASIDGWEQDDNRRSWRKATGAPNTWQMLK